MNNFFLRLHAKDGVLAFPHVISLGKETRSAHDYGIERRSWQGRPHVIFQYTLAGEGVFQHGKKLLPVPVGSGFLCSSINREIKCGCLRDSSRKWEFLFVNMAGRSAFLMARELVQRFGPVYELAPDVGILRQLTAFQPFCNVGYTPAPGECIRLAMELLQALTVSRIRGPHLLDERALADRFKAWVQLHLDRPIAVSGIAADLRVTPEHLARHFRRQADMTPYAYIQGAKIVAACDLLRSRTLSVKEVASRLGFGSPTVFTRVFKRALGITPTRFMASDQNSRGTCKTLRLGEDTSPYPLISCAFGRANRLGEPRPCVTQGVLQEPQSPDVARGPGNDRSENDRP